jgi:murein DD-endopeptidase MepM/ murein hydrolase activator NlpD
MRFNKAKYKYNPEILTYELEKQGILERIRKSFLPKFTMSLILGILFFYLFSVFISRPEELFLSDKSEGLKLKYDLLNNELDISVKKLDILKQRDDKIYRMIFQAEPISENERKAGFGGTDRYEIFRKYENSDLLIKNTRKIDILSNVMLVQSKSYDDIIELVKNTEKMASCIPAIQPIALNDLTRFGSAFGKRLHPILHIWKEHTGVDLTAPTGTKIYASGDGIVFKAGDSDGGYGNIVKINHGFGYTTFYAHMKDIYVRPGQKVKRGDIIGTVGNTGLSTSPHLHYEVRINNVPVDPVNFYYNDMTDEEYYQMIEASKNADTHIFE